MARIPLVSVGRSGACHANSDRKLPKAARVVASRLQTCDLSPADKPRSKGDRLGARVIQ